MTGQLHTVHLPLVLKSDGGVEHVAHVKKMSLKYSLSPNLTTASMRTKLINYQMHCRRARRALSHHLYKCHGIKDNNILYHNILRSKFGSYGSGYWSDPIKIHFRNKFRIYKLLKNGQTIHRREALYEGERLTNRYER